MLQNMISNPWFWAFVALLGWIMGYAVVSTKMFGSNLGFGILMLFMAEVPQIIIALPFISQPRIEPNNALFIECGSLILAGSLFCGSPVFSIHPLTRPDASEPLRTIGLYSIVRHPLMLCDIFWPLGWSLIFGAIIGILLTPIWLIVVWRMTYVEEQSLVRAYGGEYREYQSRVPRLFPRPSIFNEKDIPD
jgi:hypothetical protein